MFSLFAAPPAAAASSHDLPRYRVLFSCRFRSDAAAAMPLADTLVFRLILLPLRCYCLLVSQRAGRFLPCRACLIFTPCRRCLLYAVHALRCLAPRRAITAMLIRRCCCCYALMRDTRLQLFAPRFDILPLSLSALPCFLFSPLLLTPMPPLISRLRQFDAADMLRR